MPDPAPFRPKPSLGLVTEEPNMSKNPPVQEVEEHDDALKRALEAVPLGKSPGEYARMAAVYSYHAADASAAAHEMAGKAFGAASEASREAKATRSFLQQVMDDNPTIAARVKRTVSGSLKAVPLPIVSAPPPPPLPPLELPRNASQTGSSYTIPLDTLKKLEEQIRDRDVQQRERDAEERGRQQLLLAQANALAAQQAASKERRDRWTWILGIVAFIGGGVAYALAHLSVHP